MCELVDRDLEHLRLLKLGFYLLAGTAGFVSLFSLVYVAIGGIIASGAMPVQPGQDAAAARTVGAVFLAVGIAIFLVGLTGAFLTYLVARSLDRPRRRTFCIVMAGLWCLSIPFGTALGVCAILVLNRPSVQALFDQHGAPVVNPPPLA